jgi:hypothetical protein
MGGGKGGMREQRAAQGCSRPVQAAAAPQREALGCRQQRTLAAAGLRPAWGGEGCEGDCMYERQGGQPQSTVLCLGAATPATQAGVRGSLHVAIY